MRYSLARVSREKVLRQNTQVTVGEGRGETDSKVSICLPETVNTICQGKVHQNNSYKFAVTTCMAFEMQPYLNSLQSLCMDSLDSS